MDFKDFVQSKALEDKLPFGISFEINPIGGGEVLEEVAGFQIPVYNELLAREAWFFEMLETNNGSNLSELQILLRKLIRDLKSACSLKSLDEASKALFNPPEDLVETDEYQNFTDRHQADIDRLLELSRLAQNSQAVTWFRVTFFLLSRVDGNWTLGQTAAMRNSQLEQLNKFITKEANGGVEPEPQPEAEGEEEEGKSSVEETGLTSTGKSKK